MPNTELDKLQDQDESFEDLAAELSSDEEEIHTDDADEIPEDSSETEVDEEASESDEENDADDLTEADEKPAVPKEDPKDHQAFAQLRTERNQYKEMIEKLAQNEGKSVEEFLQAQAEAELQARAEEHKVPVEFLKRLEAMEQNELERQKELEAIKFQANIETFQTKHGLDQSEVRGFIDRCFENGINILETDVNFDILYRGLNFDGLVEQERQKWIAKDTENRDRTSTVKPGKGKSSTGSPSKIETMDDLSAIMNEMDQ